MATETQYNPNAALNQRLLDVGASKTVYALITPETESCKASTFGSFGDATRSAYMEQFRDAWTGKQDAYHEEFFDTWAEWSTPVVDLDRDQFPFYYPTNGASESLRHLIYDHSAKGGRTIHVFEGEYEGYKAMAEAAGLKIVEHKRDGIDGWHTPFGGRLNRVAWAMKGGDLFFISQPSAIDGNVWSEFNEFISTMPENSVVVDLTYVGAVPESSINERFNMNQPAIRNVVFSLSKPFGAYYDRIGGVFARKEDLGLFGNRWFKGLTGIRFGTILMKRNTVFELPTRYRKYQEAQTRLVDQAFDEISDLTPSDVFILATGTAKTDAPMAEYLKRAGKVRVCLTPGMANMIGTRGPK